MAPRPSNLRVAIEVNGDAAAAEFLELMGKRAVQTTDLMMGMVEHLRQISAERVREAPWEPLTEGTQTRKASQGEDTSILRDEWRPMKGTPTRKGDALYRALTVDGAPGQLRYSTRTMAMFGVQSSGNGPLFYARFVQNVKGKRRRLLAITGEQAVSIAERVAIWIYDGKLT